MLLCIVKELSGNYLNSSCDWPTISLIWHDDADDAGNAGNDADADDADDDGVGG